MSKKEPGYRNRAGKMRVMITHIAVLPVFPHMGANNFVIYASS